MESRVHDAQYVPGWVRVGMILAIAVPQLVTGAWAVVAPKHWFDHFPGIGPMLVAAEPPYNAHLASDAGAGFLAAGVAVAVAAILGRRMLMVFALGIYAVGALPHVLYHAINPAPDLTSAENTVSVMMLATGLAAAAVFASRTWKRASLSRGPASEEPATSRET
jgi:uncharacterized membrane protein